MKQTVRQLVVALMALFAGLSASAQVTTASISGTVKDTNGEALAGATVKATHIPSGTVYFITTQTNGKYFISGMRIGGPYEIQISYIGFAPEKIKDVTLSLGEDSKYDAVLKDDAVALKEVVVVAEQNSAINSNRTGAQEVFTKDRMSRIPSINRSLDDFTKLTPMASGRNFAGTSYRFNNVTVDGASFNNSFGLSSSLGASGVEPISLESIEQIQVMIAPFDVRNGAFTGGGINSVTKSGNNNFEGSAYYFMKNANLQGYKQKDITVDKGDFYKNQIGFSLSGPIIKNKLFFFVNAEFDRQNTPVNWRPRATDKDPITGDYSAADEKTLREITKYMQDNFNYDPGKYIVTEIPTLANKITARIDWNINNSNTLSFKYFHLTSYNTNNPSTSGAMKNGRGPNAFAIPFSSAYYRTNNNFNIFIADLHTIINPQMSNSLTIGYSRLRDYREMDGGFFPEVNIGDGSMPVTINKGRRVSTSNAFTTFGTEANSYNNKLDTDIFQIQDNFIINLDKHQLTIGTQSDYRSFLNGYSNSFAGQWQFNSLADFKADVEAHKAWVAAGSPQGSRPKSLATYYAQNYSLQDGFPFAKVDVLSLGFYVQDKWSIKENFNLTMGLRMDIPIFMTELMENPAVEKLTFQDGRKIDVSKYPGTTVLFSPRIGFNWDVFSNKTLQIRGGSGIFTGTPPYVWLSNQAGNNGLLFGRTDDSHAFDGVVDIPKPTGAGAQKSQIAITDENFKYPQLWKSNIAIDYSFGDGWIATVEMLYNKDINAIYHKDINHPAIGSKEVITLNGGADNRPYFANKSLNGGSIVDAILMTNTSKGYSIYTTLQLQKNFMRGPLDGLYLNASYTFGKSMSVTDGTSSVASSAYKYHAAVMPDAEELGYSAGSFPHRLLVQASYKKPWSKYLATTVGLVYQMYMPFRYSYTYAGDVNGDGYGFNDLMFVPATKDQINIVPIKGDKRSVDEIWAGMDEFFNQDPYLKNRRGMYTERNGGKAPYVHQLDFSLSQDFILPQTSGKKHTLRLSLDINNFLNLINKNWGVQKTTVLNYQQYQYLSVSQAPSNENNYTPGFTTTIDKKTGKDMVTETFKDFISPASRWSMMIGIKYIFN